MLSNSRGLALTGSAMLALFLAISALGDVRVRMELFLGLYVALFAVYALSLRQSVFASGGILLRPGGTAIPALRMASPVELILGFAIAFRVAALIGFPQLSDDIFRYIWDARVFSAGMNPYAHAPADPSLARLRDAFIFPHVNHPEVPTIYPPLLQVLFWLVYHLSPSLMAFKLLPTAFDVGTIFLLLTMVRRLGLPPAAVVVYAWNPLVILETSANGHLDAIGAFFLVLFLATISNQLRLRAALPLALATLTKFAPILLLPFLWARKHPLKSFVFAGVTLAVLFGFYLPFMDGHSEISAALRIYADKWRFNDSLFAVVFLPVAKALPEQAVRQFAFFHHLSPVAETLASLRIDLALLITKVILGSGFLIFLAIVFQNLRPAGGPSAAALSRLWLWVFGTLCLISPTLHPWYLIWLVPVLVFTPNRAWLLLTGTIMLSYSNLPQYHATGVWEEYLWAKLLLYVPFYGLLFYDAVKPAWAARRRDRSPQAHPAPGQEKANGRPRSKTPAS